jgi:peroxiredoxin
VFNFHERFSALIRVLFFIILFLPAISQAQGLSDFNGNPRSLDEFTGKGKWVVVMIWAHNCPLCNQEVQKFDIFHADHEERDAMVVGVSIDGGYNDQKAREFIDRHELGFPNLIGDARSVARLHIDLSGQRLVGTPTFLLFAPTGELVGMQVGPLEPEMIESFMVKNANNPGSS